MALFGRNKKPKTRSRNNLTRLGGALQLTVLCQECGNVVGYTDRAYKESDARTHYRKNHPNVTIK